ncbi:MAG: mandelate racemase/muconate lactonizing enzyme family protein [Gammaproteobacteria bacterium]|nr:mandelate racemase/muconate lactonizing enzyme family protein [Gammaproteobacteria bacterium]
MKITEIKTFHCPAGWRRYHFVRVTLENGIIGWSEYDEGFDAVGVTTAINRLSRAAVGEDAINHEGIYARLAATSRQSLYGVLPRAIGAIENAILDAKAKHFGVPCYEILGGKVRDEIRVYWSHCGTWRISRPGEFAAPVRNLDDIRSLGREVAAEGFTALKTNIFRETENGMVGWSPGFNRNDDPSRTPPRHVLNGLVDYLQAFRDGCGPDMDILLDLNYNARTEGYLAILRALQDLDIFWVEIDTPYPQALATIRKHSPFTVSGCESLTGMVEYLPYLQAEALDVAIIDVPWNGAWQSLKIAAMADAFQVNVAPHNYYGHLSTMMSAHFCAVAPNLKIMETDIDRVAEDATIFTHAPEIVNGMLLMPDRPGWGTEPNPDVLSEELDTRS